MPYPLLIGSTGSLHFAGEIGNAAMGLPFTVILDAEGSIRHVKLGILKESELEEKLTGLLPRLSGDLDKRRHFAANFHDHA